MARSEHFSIEHSDSAVKSVKEVFVSQNTSGTTFDEIEIEQLLSEIIRKFEKLEKCLKNKLNLDLYIQENDSHFRQEGSVFSLPTTRIQSVDKQLVALEKQIKRIEKLLNEEFNCEIKTTNTRLKETNLVVWQGKSTGQDDNEGPEYTKESYKQNNIKSQNKILAENFEVNGVKKNEVRKKWCAKRRLKSTAQEKSFETQSYVCEIARDTLLYKNPDPSQLVIYKTKQIFGEHLNKIVVELKCESKNNSQNVQEIRILSYKNLEIVSWILTYLKKEKTDYDNFLPTSNNPETTKISKVSNELESSKLSFNIHVDQLEKEYAGILSVCNDKLLVSWWSFPQLYIYSLESRHLISTITLDDNDGLQDAIWTALGNIVYTTWDSENVVTISESGKIIAHTAMTAPRCLSVSTDNFIYLADWETGLYQSTDDGITWNFVFKPTDDWHCWQVIKVITDISNDFWALECNDEGCCRLTQYSMCKKSAECNVTRKDINLSEADQHIDLSYSSLSYDGKTNIFLSDYHNKIVHILSANGLYNYQLLSLDNKPSKLAIDGLRLYVGQQHGVVGVFDLIYLNDRITAKSDDETIP